MPAGAPSFLLSAPARPHSNSTRSRRWPRCDRRDAVSMIIRESTRRAREARRVHCSNTHERATQASRPTPRAAPRHNPASSLLRRRRGLPRARAGGPRRDLLHRHGDLRQRPGRRRRRRDRGLRGHGLRRFGDRHRGPARSVGRLYNRTTPAPGRRPGPRRGPGPGPAGADPDLGVGHLPARRPRGRVRATRCSTNQRSPGHFWSVPASYFRIDAVDGTRASIVVDAVDARGRRHRD